MCACVRACVCGDVYVAHTIIIPLRYYRSGGTAVQGGVANNNRFWLDNVDCSGNEDNIMDCDHGGWGTHDCAKSEAAKVVC